MLRRTVLVAGLRQAVSRRSRHASRLLLAADRRLDAGRDRSWRELADSLEGVAPSLVTVDVFDTVLTRTLVGDEALWWVTAVRLRDLGEWTPSPSAFPAARRAAARARPHGDLTSLYEAPELARHLTGSAGPSTEAAVEAELAVAVPGAVAGLERLRTAGHRICFVSDMHLDPVDLRACLERHGLFVPGDDLVVSSAVGASKSAGTLFPQLRAAGRVASWHIGNDLWSDVAMAERSGVRALPVRLAESSALERAMAADAGSVGSAIAGAARQVRISGAALPEDRAVLRDVGADVAGQALTAFLLWVRDQCEQAGVEQVRFLARDGELPLLMAQAMPADHWAGLPLRYLYGNRRLWSLAAAAVVGPEAWLSAGLDDRGFLRQNQHVIPWRSLLDRAGLTPEDVEPHPALAALSPDEPLPPHLLTAWEAALADERVRARLSARAADQLADLQQHLADEGVGTGRVALVDVGWRGQLAWQMSAVLRETTGQEPVHLHFGGVDLASDDHPADIRRFAVDDSRAPLPFHDVISCVETFTASGAERARAIQRDDAGRVSLLFDAALPHMQTEQRQVLRQGAIDVAASLPSRSALARWGLHDDGIDARVREVLTQFWQSPTQRHARAGAQLSSETDDAGIDVVRVATPYALGELWRGGATRTWREGSLRLTRQPLRSVIAVALRSRDRTRGRRADEAVGRAAPPATDPDPGGSAAPRERPDGSHQARPADAPVAVAAAAVADR